MTRRQIVTLWVAAASFLCAIAAPDSSTARAAEVEMKAGVAKTVITNTEPRVMVNGRVSRGVLRDIHARALVLSDGASRLVIITYDLNCLDVATPILRARVQDELGIDPSRLILLATHNHNAPIQIIPDNFDYGRVLAERMFELVREAIANERGPVRISFGSGRGDFITSRGNAPVDYEIQVLKVADAERTLALLFNHGTHPMQASRYQIEGGHPGFAMDEIEEKIPGVQAMYADASGGNQFPLRPRGFEHLPRDLRGKIEDDEVRKAVARALGHELAEATLEIAAAELQDVTGPIHSTLETLSLPLAPPISREEALELAKEFPEDVGFVAYTKSEHRSTNWVRMLLRYYEEGLPFPTRTTDMVGTDDTYLILKSDEELLEKYADSLHDRFPNVYEEVIVSRIGSLMFVAMQGEVCAPIGARIKDAFRRDTPIMVFGYMGEHNLYIPTRELVRQKAYQGIVIQIQYASPVGWAPEVEDEMVAGVVRMVESMTEAPPPESRALGPASPESAKR
jgi:hypothetical protein